MTTFIHRGALLPPGGPDDGMSMGVLNRHQEVTTSLTLTLLEHVYLTPGDDDDAPLPVYIKHGDAQSVGVKIVAVGAHTNVSVTITVDSASVSGTYAPHAGSVGGAYFQDDIEVDTESEIEAELASLNTGWTVALTGAEESTWTFTFTRAALSEGTHAIYLKYNDSGGAG
jgi:hypothetical protein